MVRRFGDRETSHSDRMASSGLSLVLALAIPIARRAAQGKRRDQESHLPNEF
jgi:hypothetical protein